MIKSVILAAVIATVGASAYADDACPKGLYCFTLPQLKGLIGEQIEEAKLTSMRSTPDVKAALDKITPPPAKPAE